MVKARLLRITTVPISLLILLKGQLQYMQLHGFDVLAVSADGPEVSELTHLGIPHEVIPFTRSITLWKDLHCLFRLVRLIRKFHPDIVHTHTPKAGLLGMMAAWICRVPYRMHTVAGLPYQETQGLRRAILRITELATYSFARNVFPNSNGLLRYMQAEFPFHIRKYKVIGRGSSNGVDVNHYTVNDNLLVEQTHTRSRNNIPGDHFVYCFVGRLVRDKGIAELVQAFAQLSEQWNDVWLFLVGHFEQDHDPLPPDIKEQIIRHRRIIHEGFQRDIRPWVLASNVLVLPSYREGFPNVLLQAGCLLKPCIATDINGCNEIIQDQLTGLLIPTKDVQSLKSAMTKLYTDRNLGVRAGKDARNFISKNYDQLYIWNEILKEYQKHLGLCI